MRKTKSVQSRDGLVGTRGSEVNLTSGCWRLVENVRCLSSIMWLAGVAYLLAFGSPIFTLVNTQGLIGVLWYSNKARWTSLPSSATFFLSCFVALTNISLWPFDWACWGLRVLTSKPQSLANWINSLLPNGILSVMTVLGIPCLAKQVFRYDTTHIAVLVISLDTSGYFEY